MSHKSSLRSSNILLTAATAIVSVVAVLSGLELASETFPWLTPGLSNSRVSSANKQLQAHFTEFSGEAAQQRRSAVNSTRSQAVTEKPPESRQPQRQNSNRLNNHLSTAAGLHAPFPAINSRIPQVSVPVTINVDNGELLSELLRVKQQVSELANRHQPAPASIEATCGDEQSIHYEVHSETTAKTGREIAETSRKCQSDQPSGMPSSIAWMEPEPDFQASEPSTVSVEILPRKVPSQPGASADAPAVVLAEPVSGLAFDDSRIVPTGTPITIEAGEPVAYATEQHQDSISGFAIPVEASRVEPIGELSLSNEASPPPISIPLALRPTEVSPVLPEMIGQTDSIGPSSPDATTMVTSVAAGQGMQIPASAEPQMPVAVPDLAFENDDENLLKIEPLDPSPAPLVTEANSATVIPGGSSADFLQPFSELAEPAVPNVDLSGSVASSGTDSEPFLPPRTVQPRKKTSKGMSKQAVISVNTLKDARDRLGDFLRQPATPDFEAPEWTDELSVSEPVERIRNSQVVHRITSAVRFAARPRTVE